MKFYIPFIFVLFVLNIKAQDKKQNRIDFDIETSFSIGVKDLYVEQFKTTNYIDFLNYADCNPDFIDDSYVKLGMKLGLLDKVYTDMNIILGSDFAPDTYDFSLNILPIKHLGIGFGIMRNKVYISSFEKFHLETHPDYYLMDNNVRQFINYNAGFYISPLIRPIYNDHLKIDLKLDIGLASFRQNLTAFYLKKKLSNERISYEYLTKRKFELYINPKLNLRLKIFNIQKANIGLLLNSNFYYSKKRINYKQFYSKWVDSNPRIDYIRSPSHTFEEFNIDMGVYVKW